MIFRIITTLFFIYFFYSCANQQKPTGGAVDSQPPILVKAVPDTNQLNFKSRELTFEFSEIIEAENLNEQILITPITDNKFTYTTKGKTLKILFEKDLLPNTTYYVNLRNSIKDITESNKTTDVSIAFSTGEILDTLKFSGEVKNLLTNKYVQGALVSLYKSGDTSSILDDKPLYIGKTDLNGNYRINNIKEGNYDVFAITDNNNDLFYNPVTESIGYQLNFQLKQDTTKNFSIIKHDTIPPGIKSINRYKKEIHINLNQGVRYYSVTDNDTTKLNFYKITEDRRKIILFNNISDLKSTNYKIILTDSSYNQSVIDTILSFNPEKEFKEIRPLIKTYVPSDKTLKPADIEIGIEFNYPIKQTDFENLRIQKDSILESVKIEEYKWNNERTKFTIQKKYSSFDSLYLILPEKTFISIYDSSNKYTKERFHLKNPEEYSSLSGRIITNKKNYVVELTDLRGTVIDTLINPQTFNFNFLLPGSYLLKVLVDENGNGKWDNGNLFQKKQPEPIYFYKDEIKTRANWEINNLVWTF